MKNPTEGGLQVQPIPPEKAAKLFEAMRKGVDTPSINEEQLVEIETANSTPKIGRKLAKKSNMSANMKTNWLSDWERKQEEAEDRLRKQSQTNPSTETDSH